MQNKMAEGLAINAQGVSKRYQLGTRAISLRNAVTGERGKRPIVDAVNKVTFSVAKGEVLGLIGRNGSGKSSLIRMIAGIYRPTEGRIQVRGRLTALVELGAGFDQQLSGRENIYMNASGHGLSRQETESSVGDIIEFAGIGRFIDFPMETYSTGMRARLGFAVATALNPDVLVADEITAVGDVRFADQCFNHFDYMSKKGTTVLLASHNLNRLCDVASRVLWLDNGEVRQIGPAQETVDAYRTFMRSTDEGKQS